MKTPRSLAAAIACAVLLLGAGCSQKPSAEKLRAWEAEVARLQVEQDSLRARGRELVERDPRILALPEGDVVIAVPASFLRDVIGHVFTDVASNVTLKISGIKAHVAKSVKKVVKIGEFTVDVEILDITGLLEPGAPEIGFGGEKISIALPVEVTEGYGEARIHFIWDGKNVADLTCGDMDITQVVSGNVIPAQYKLTGAFHVDIQGNRVVGTLKFPETYVRIKVEPTKESWAVVDSILADKEGVCGWVLEKVDVKNLLTGVVQEKGFNVKLPLDKIKPFRVPAGVSESIELEGRTIALEVQTRTLRIDPDAIWYSADIGVREDSTRGAASD